MTAPAAVSQQSFMLALETATPVCSVALVRVGRTIATSCLVVGLRHSRLLFTEIERLLSTAGTTLAQLSHVAVSIGPGSFTGLRIGLSAAKGICLPRNVPLIPVRTLQALAARIPFARDPVCAMMDARRGQVYVALYDTRSGWPEALSEEQAMAPEELVAWRRGRPTVFSGPGTAVCADYLNALCSDASLAPPELCRPDAAAVGQLAAHGVSGGRMQGCQGQSMETLEPAYLRLPDLGTPAGHDSRR